MGRELRLIVTQSCNYQCYFCHREGIEKDAKTLLNSSDYEYLFKICKKEFDWNEVSITGGEPFMNKEIDSIIKKLYDEFLGDIGGHNAHKYLHTHYFDKSKIFSKKLKDFSEECLNI